MTGIRPDPYNPLAGAGPGIGRQGNLSFRFQKNIGPGDEAGADTSGKGLNPLLKPFACRLSNIGFLHEISKSGYRQTFQTGFDIAHHQKTGFIFTAGSVHTKKKLTGCRSKHMIPCTGLPVILEHYRKNFHLSGLNPPDHILPVQQKRSVCLCRHGMAVLVEYPLNCRLHPYPIPGEIKKSPF